MMEKVASAASHLQSLEFNQEDLCVEVFEDPTVFAKLEPAWRELGCTAGASEPFVQPEWIRAWWEAFGRKGQLRVVTAWQGDRLVGILPLMLGRVRRYGIPVRRLGALTNVHSPRIDLMFAPDVDGVVDAIWRYIADTEGQWDIFELPRLLSSSPVLQRFSDRARSDAFRFGWWQAAASPFIEIRTDWNSYLSERSRNFRKEVRRKLRRLSKLAQPSLEIVVDPAAMPAALEAGFDIEADGWKGRERVAMKSVADVRSFYCRLAERTVERGTLRLHFLKLGEERIAFDFSIEFERRLYSLKSGFRDSHSTNSPGLVLLSLMLEHYMSSEVREIDLLGEEDDFKRRWTRATRSHHWFICFARTPRGRAIHWIKFEFMPKFKRLRSRLRRACGIP